MNLSPALFSTASLLVLALPSCVSFALPETPGMANATALDPSLPDNSGKTNPARHSVGGSSKPKSKARRKAPFPAGTYVTGTGGPTWFKITFERSSKGWSCSFPAAQSSGLGAAPDGGGTGQVKADGALHFNFEDSFENQGTGIFRRTSGGRYELVMRITKVVEPRCLRLYGDVLPMRKTAG